jgi:hypothetical protein
MKNEKNGDPPGPSSDRCEVPGEGTLNPQFTKLQTSINFV